VALAPFFERVYGAIGGHLAISRESLDGILGGVNVGIQLDAIPSDNELWIASLTVNLAARIYPRLAITGPDKISSELKSLAQSINPDMEFSESAKATATVCIGVNGSKDGICPTASGWVARLGRASVRSDGPNNPYSAGAAACLACAELFRRIFVGESSDREIAVSLLNYDNCTGADRKHTKTDIGDTVFVGIGAVGNAALWTIVRDTTIRGKIKLVDAETLELSNLQRYVLASYADIGNAKVDLAKSALGASNLEIETYKTKLDDFSKSHDPFNVPTLVISVDNLQARRSAQALLPRLVINGWTGEQALGASWHVFRRDAACLACLYHPHGQGLSAIEQAARALGLPNDRAAQLWVTRQPLSSDDLKVVSHTLGLKEAELAPWRHRSLGEIYTEVVCGAVPLNVKGITRVEMVPLAHQSALAGILMAAELVKRTQPELAKHSQTEPLVSWDNILQPPPTIWSKPRAREPGCICGDQDYQTVYQTKWAKSLKVRGHRD
jgi:hypothetical protein